MASLKKKFDLILMDCNMPVMDGYEATKKIRKLILEKEMDKCPILAISAYCKSGEETNWQEAGMDDFFEKPLTKKKFQEIYRKWLLEINN
jgi:CheY-like chemotaxis protein